MKKWLLVIAVVTLMASIVIGLSLQKRFALGETQVREECARIESEFSEQLAFLKSVDVLGSPDGVRSAREQGLFTDERVVAAAIENLLQFKASGFREYREEQTNAGLYGEGLRKTGERVIYVGYVGRNDPSGREFVLKIAVQRQE